MKQLIIQLAVTCSKLTVEITETPAIGVVLVSLLLTLNIFHTLFSVSIVNFEQVNAGWVASLSYTSTKECSLIQPIICIGFTTRQ